jgi:hypothetical protein
MEKLRIEKVPEDRELEGVKRWEEEKGGSSRLPTVKRSATLPGSRYAKVSARDALPREETGALYVISGKIRAVFIDLDTRSRRSTS